MSGSGDILANVRDIFFAPDLSMIWSNSTLLYCLNTCWDIAMGYQFYDHTCQHEIGKVCGVSIAKRTRL